MNFVNRHPGPELMDGENIPEEDLFRNYYELHVINKYLGGYRITLNALNQFSFYKKEISILDIGCGGGDMIKQIYYWGKKRNLNLQLTGVDLSEAAIRYSKLNCKNLEGVEFINADAFHYLKNPNEYDIVSATLFMHHFTNENIIQLLQLMYNRSRYGVVVNDLHRHSLAHKSIQVITQLFSSSYLVKNDAPLSVARGFTKTELQELAIQSGVFSFELKWKWAYRYQMILKKQDGAI